MAKRLELNDIQGVLGRGYGKLKYACFACYQMVDVEESLKSLESILKYVEDATEPSPDKFAFNIAFTHQGLQKIGLGSSCLDEFPRVFRNGMSDPNKSRILGDMGENSPDNWTWGSADNMPHFALMIYGVDQNTLHKMLGLESAPAGPLNDIANAVKSLKSKQNEISRSESFPLPDHKEHFGFRDGISQPKIAGIKERKRGGNVVAPGEFILGYKDEYDLIPNTPRVYMLDDPMGYLPPHDHDPDYRDLGRNGSYMVYRKLDQDVHKFWDFIKEQAPEADEQLLWASKMVGRWPNGCPFSKSADQPHDLQKMHDDNDFHFTEDTLGMLCPVGSHVRRSNPRHSTFPNTKHPVTEHTTHRILRRGRTYGKPVSESLTVKDLLNLKASDTKGDRGLNFICFNTNIERQFEFIQQSWCMNPKFAGLRNDPDPILGQPNDKGKSDFTMPADPVRKKISQVPQFVTVKAGAYFFMPGISSLKYLLAFRQN